MVHVNYRLAEGMNHTLRVAIIINQSFFGTEKRVCEIYTWYAVMNNIVLVATLDILLIYQGISVSHFVLSSLEYIFDTEIFSLCSLWKKSKSLNWLSPTLGAEYRSAFGLHNLA